jgi:hypothetical protein
VGPYPTWFQYQRAESAELRSESSTSPDRRANFPGGEYQWIDGFDVSRGDGFTGSRLADNIFDGSRDRWYVI